jgi:hypothetical protein
LPPSERRNDGVSSSIVHAGGRGNAIAGRFFVAIGLGQCGAVFVVCEAVWSGSLPRGWPVAYAGAGFVGACVGHGWHLRRLPCCFFRVSFSRRGFIKMKADKYFSVATVKDDFFPARSMKWIRNTFRGGKYGPVMREASGWAISEAAIIEYQRQHAVNIVPLRIGQRSNLKQFAS